MPGQHAQAVPELRGDQLQAPLDTWPQNLRALSRNSAKGQGGLRGTHSDASLPWSLATTARSSTLTFSGPSRLAAVSPPAHPTLARSAKAKRAYRASGDRGAAGGRFRDQSRCKCLSPPTRLHAHPPRGPAGIRPSLRTQPSPPSGRATPSPVFAFGARGLYEWRGRGP